MRALDDLKAQADADVEARTAEFLTAARQFWAEPGTQGVAANALRALKEAEARRAALDKPRLMTPEEAVATILAENPHGGVLRAAIAWDRKHVEAALASLPRRAFRWEGDPLGRRSTWIDSADVWELMHPQAQEPAS